MSKPTTLLEDDDDINSALAYSKVGPKVDFQVAFDFSQRDNAQPIRATVPKDESYDKFLWRLHHVFYGDSFERSLRQWEYVLVSRQYEKGNPLPLTSPNTYYAMVSELLRPRSHWRNALIRRSHSENPIIKAIAEGTFNLTPGPPNLDASLIDVSTVDILSVADASQPDASTVDSPMLDAPQATPEVLTSTPPSRARVIDSASKIPSPGPSVEPNTPVPSTPSKPAASARGRRLSPLSSLLGSSARARDPTQSSLPLISSPLAPVTSKGGRRSIRLSSPRATITSSARSGQLNSLISPPASTQSPVLLGSSPSTPAVSTQVPQTQSILPSVPSVIALHSAILPSSTTLPANSVQNTSVPVSSRLASAAIAQDTAIQLSSMTSPAAEASPTRQHGTTLEPTTSVQRASVHLSSPLGQPSLPIVCAGKAQAPLAILPIESVPLAPQGSGSTVGLGALISPIAPALIVPRPSAIPAIPLGSASSSAPSPELFQRSLNLPPRPTSTSTSREQAQPTKPTLIHQPRRPLWIVSRQRLNSGTEYQVQWNNGTRSWEPHDGLYRDYPALIDKYLEGQP